MVSVIPTIYAGKAQEPGETYEQFLQPRGNVFAAAGAGGDGGDDHWDQSKYRFAYPEWREAEHGFRPANVLILGHSFVRRLSPISHYGAWPSLQPRYRV